MRQRADRQPRSSSNQALGLHSYENPLYLQLETLAEGTPEGARP